MLSSLFITQVVSEVGHLLETSGTGDRVVVCDQSRFGRALAASGVSVVLLASKRRSLRRGTGGRVQGHASQLPLAAASVSALVSFGLGHREAWLPFLAEWSRAVRENGRIVLVDKSPPAELTRRALCGGLANIEQCHAGRYVITSGTVTKLPD